MGKEFERNKGKKEGVRLLSSIKFKITLLTAAAVIIAVAGILIPTALITREQNYEMVKNYMLDSAIANGSIIEYELDEHGAAFLDDYEEMKEKLSGVGVTGVKSSYAFVLDGSGRMRYHKNQDLVGNENSVDAYNGIISTIQQGVHPEPAFMEYTYNGIHKFVAYFVDDENLSIMVITADEEDIMSGINATMVQMTVLAVIVMLVFVGIAVFVASRISNPIVRIGKSVDKMGNLDFTEDENLGSLAKRKDETGEMARALQTVTRILGKVTVNMREQSDRIRETSASLAKDTGETATSISQVESAINEIADGATSQAGETQQATENVIVMGNLVEESLTEINTLVDNARIMQDSGSEATSTLRSLEEINRQALESIEVISRQTNTTNEAAQKIRTAANIIKSIADETNLLSLNASIEAARAGDQGRGFAVVASEIQKLAEQSNVSAHQIESIIDELVSDSQKAVETMSEVTEVMNRQNENVILTQEKFVQVTKGIDLSIDGIRALRSKSQELDQTRISVVDIVQNLTAIAEENAASTEETSASATEIAAIVGDIEGKAGELKGIADELDNQMKQFTI